MTTGVSGANPGVGGGVGPGFSQNASGVAVVVPEQPVPIANEVEDDEDVDREDDRDEAGRLPQETDADFSKQRVVPRLNALRLMFLKFAMQLALQRQLEISAQHLV